ncbi:hypothetical protein LPMP_311650 [Leishmania panamensis]|uniref:Uncharacterized protein n=1 Tax=Leishmania panamensis TaxID=5679 RepID=A0A088RZP8_LEIPA|nr:hypothetical protein LPMP_311650 [Leishmania panamensis]AIO00755.1 hypothetical protein LPMP_311650 [Leishmania panamensis]
MASESSVAIGVGITLALFVLFAILLIIFGICTNDGSASNFSPDREARVAQARQRHQLEQEQWRERRLRDVVLLLIERGEAQEGVSLAFQLPNRPEVSARRALRNRRGPSSLRQNLAIELANEQENSRLDPEALMIAHRPLEELLANGRPADADPGPDVMQMLLDGQEIQQHTSSEDDSDFYPDEDEMRITSTTPFLSQQVNDEALLGRGGGRPSDSGRASPTPSPNLDPAQQQQQQGDGATTSNAVGTDADIDARTAAMLLEEQRLRENREKALLIELGRERRRKHRKPAEDVYGEGADYEVNPANKRFLRIDASENFSFHTPLMRFLSPLKSFRGSLSRTGRKSAFDGLSPQESYIQQREDTAMAKSFSSQKAKNYSFREPHF